MESTSQESTYIIGVRSIGWLRRHSIIVLVTHDLPRRFFIHSKIMSFVRTFPAKFRPIRPILLRPRPLSTGKEDRHARSRPGNPTPPTHERSSDPSWGPDAEVDVETPLSSATHEPDTTVLGGRLSMNKDKTATESERGESSEKGDMDRMGQIDVEEVKDPREQSGESRRRS
jgi:hypothetical protein